MAKLRFSPIADHRNPAETVSVTPNGEQTGTRFGTQLTGEMRTREGEMVKTVWPRR